MSVVKKIRLLGGRGDGFEAQVPAEFDAFRFAYTEDSEVADIYGLYPDEVGYQVYRDSHERQGEFVIFRP